jgi:hypothetical protein
MEFSASLVRFELSPNVRRALFVMAVAAAAAAAAAAAFGSFFASSAQCLTAAFCLDSMYHIQIRTGSYYYRLCA